MELRLALGRGNGRSCPAKGTRRCQLGRDRGLHERERGVERADIIIGQAEERRQSPTASCFTREGTSAN